MNITEQITENNEENGFYVPGSDAWQYKLCSLRISMQMEKCTGKKMCTHSIQVNVLDWECTNERTSRASHTHMIRKQGYSNLWQTLDIAIVKHTYIRNWIDTADTADTKFNSNSFSLCFSHITIQSETTAKHTIKMRIKPNKWIKRIES